MLLVPRRFRITIGGLDHTDCILSFDGGDEKLTFTSGLIIFRGTLVLGRSLGTESLDDRKNKRWNRGTPIIVEISDDSGVLRRSPRGGHLFILSSVYDFTTRELTLEVGDAFALFSIREGSGDKTGVCLGSAEDKTIVINRLLSASGAPALIDTVPGSLSAGAPKLVEGSYIEQAGSIANGSGYFLWVDSQNRSRATELKTDRGNPILTIDLSLKASNFKRLTGESPAAWFVVDSSEESTSFSKYGFESTSESYGPIAIAGVPMFGEIIIRREWQKESLSGSQRFVQTKVWEPAGACIPLLKGTANSILSYNKTEIFEYESAAPVAGNSNSDQCQTGNQGRLKKRSLTVYRPLGAVLDRVIQSAPEANRPTALDSPILALKEVEEFDYGSTIAISTVQQIENPNASSNDIPPDDPTTQQESSAYGITHTLKRREPAGAISPEDFEWEAITPMWIASASNLTDSYELVKEWTEARSDEWIAIERERVSFNRAQPEAAAENRDRIKTAYGSSYPKDLFCALQMVRNDRTVSSTGNTQPPAPNTIPSKYSTKTTPKSYKYKTPIDTDFPFRQKTQEFNIQHLSIDGNLLAERWAKIGWGRFKGMSVQSEFVQDWWNYTPLSRIDLLEPVIDIAGDYLDQSAYLADGFAIAIADQECVIGFDGIFLGFVKNSLITPPYVEVIFREAIATSTLQTRIYDAIDTTPEVRSATFIQIQTLKTSISINPVEGLKIRPLSNVIRDSIEIDAAGNSILNPATGYREAYKLDAFWYTPPPDRPDLYNTGPAIDRYEVSLRKNGGSWSVPIPTSNPYFRIESILDPIPGISFVSTGTNSFGFVGPGDYEIRVKAIAVSGGYSEAIARQSFPTRATEIYISNPNGGTPIEAGDTVVLNASISTVNPPIVVAAGSPGYGASQIVWSEIGPGSIVSNPDGTASFTASNSAYVEGSTNPAEGMSVITATIVGTNISHTVDIRQVARTARYSITSLQLFGQGNASSPLQISAASSSLYRIKAANLPQTTATNGIEVGSIVQGNGDFPADLDLLWSIVSGPGSLSYEFYSPLESPGERVVFTPGAVGTTVIRSAAPNGIAATYTIENLPISITGISFSIPSGGTFLVNSVFDVIATVQGTGVFNTGVTWSIVSGVDSFSPNMSMANAGNKTTISILSGSLAGEPIVIRARSQQDTSVFADFALIAKTNVTGVVVVPLKSETVPTDTISARAYLTGFGKGVGPTTIGTQTFTWSVAGPATAQNSTGALLTAIASNNAGNIQIVANYEGFSGNAIVNNLGILPSAAVQPIASYSVSSTGFVKVAGSYGSLNDSSNTTGVAIGDTNN